jgi:hypothetical protein
MKSVIKAALRINDMTAIVIHESIVKAAGIRDGELWSQEVTDEGILLKRLEDKP